MNTTGEVFEIDASVENQVRRRGSSGLYQTESSDDVARAVHDGSDGPSRIPTDEETPLLDGEDSHSGGPPQDGVEWEGAKDFEGFPWWKKPSGFWLIPPFIIYTLAFGGTFVPRLNLILTLICKQYLAKNAPEASYPSIILGVDNPDCMTNDDIQKLATQFSTYASLISGILSAITSPKIGTLSDRYGRIKLLAISSIGMLLSEVLFIVAGSFPDTVSVYWILLGSVADGICGSFTAALALGYSYAADTTPPAYRNVMFGYLYGCLFTGIAIGPILAGYVVKLTGSLISVFYIALGGHLVFLSFLIFVVPESLSIRRRQAAAEKHRVSKAEDQRTWLQTLKSANLFAPLAILFPVGKGSSRALRSNLLLLAAVDTTMFSVAMGSMTVVIYYSEKMFGWGTLESSIFVSVVNTCRVTALILILPGLTRVVRKYIKSPKSGSDIFDLSVIRTAIFFDTLGYIGYSLSRVGVVFVLSGAVAALGGVGSPTISSALTKHVPADRTGQLLGAMGLLHALTRVFSPTICNTIYSLTVKTVPQTVFYCLTATFGFAFVLSWFVQPNVFLNDANDDSEDSPASTNERPEETEPLFA